MKRMQQQISLPLPCPASANTTLMLRHFVRDFAAPSTLAMREKDTNIVPNRAFGVSLVHERQDYTQEICTVGLRCRSGHGCQWRQR